MMSEDSDIPAGFGGPKCGGKTATQFIAMLSQTNPELVEGFIKVLEESMNSDKATEVKKEIWQQAHEKAATVLEDIEAGICGQPGLAAVIAQFSIEKVAEERERLAPIPESSLQKVAEFHEAFDTPVGEHPTIPRRDRRKLRIELIREELEELENAEDIVEIADALVDLHYVVMGSVLEFGLQGIFRELFDEVHDSNMSKLDDEGNPIFREDGKVLKSKNYRAPELAKIIFNDTNFIPEDK